MSRAGGVFGSTTVYVPPALADWPNEPAGFASFFPTSTVDWVGSVPTQNDGTWPSVSGWSVLNASGNGSIVTDATAPFLTTGVLQAKYNIGFQGGSGVVTPYIDSAPSVHNEIYIGFCIKLSSPYQISNIGNQKLCYALWNTTSNSFLALEAYGTAAPLEFAVIPVRWPVDTIYHAGAASNGTKTNIVLNTWYRLEYYFKYATTSVSADGIIRWWASSWNGTSFDAPVMQGNLQNVQSPNNAGGSLLEMYNGWNDTGTKIQIDYVWYNRLRASYRTP